MTRVTPRQLNRATLERQMLLRRESLDVVAAVARLVGLQAQEPASPYLALWNRLSSFDPSQLDAAFATRRIVKAPLLRITLHAVAAADYPAFHEAVVRTLRAARLTDSRFSVAGLSAAEADALVPEIVAFAAEPRTNAEMDAWLDERLGVLPKPGVWWAMRSYGPFVHHPTGGPWSFGPRPAYVAAPVEERSPDPAVSVQRLVRRYLEGFGPATVHDIAQFSTIYRPPVREALTALGSSIRTLEGPDGAALFDVVDGSIPPEDTPAPPHLMAMWDNVLLAYADRSRVIPPGYRPHVIRRNGDTLPTLLVDGAVAGVWRATERGIEATAFHGLPEDSWEGLDREARALRAFIADRDPTVYRRYGRWWDRLPAADVRLLGD